MTPNPPEGQAERRDRLEIVPTTLAEANAFVEQHHRHHFPVVGHLFSLAVASGDEVVGIAIVGRPLARGLQDGFTAEVTRCCTDGTEHAPSKLYAAAWRAARAVGYRRLVTYTLATEGGASLRAAGWKIVGQVKGREWHTPSRPRVAKNPAQLEMKTRWEVAA